MRIEMKDVNFGYGSEKVLHGIDLDLDSTGLICIVGPNGVGKSTLIRLMLGLYKPDTGAVLINGHDISGLSSKEIAKVMGYVPVGSGSVFSMTVLDTVMMGRHPHRRAGVTSDLDWKIVKRSLNMMGILDLAMKNANELSAGQHQKMSIAKGLAQTPRVLILDEPTSNLEVRHQLQVTERLRDIAKENEMTVIMVSHDLNTSAKYADLIVMMAPPGVIHKVGSPEEVLTAESVSEIYGVECTVVDSNGRPHIILEKALDDEEIHRKNHEKPSDRCLQTDSESLMPAIGPKRPDRCSERSIQRSRDADMA